MSSMLSDSLVESSRHLKRIIPVLHKLIPGAEEAATLSYELCEASVKSRAKPEALWQITRSLRQRKIHADVPREDVCS